MCVLPSIDTSQLHSVLRCIKESGSLILGYAVTDIELADAGLMMPEQDDENLFEDLAAEDQLAEEDLAENELVAEDIIPNYQLAALQEVENELLGFENSRVPIGRMSYRSLGVQPVSMEHESDESPVLTYYVMQPAQLPPSPRPPPPPPFQVPQAVFQPSTSSQADVQPSTSTAQKKKRPAER